MPRSSSRVSGSVAITMAASPGPASSSGPWRNCAVWRDSTGMPTASFRVRAPISAAARARTRAEDHQSSRGRRARSRARRPACPVASRSSIAAAASSASVRNAFGDLVGATPGDRSADAPITTSAAANVIVDGPVSSPARVSSVMSASPGERVVRPVRHRRRSGARRRGARSCSATRTISALSPDWLTTIRIVAGPQDRPAGNGAARRRRVIDGRDARARASDRHGAG